jgi:CheY-like chemotaxis protein
MSQQTEVSSSREHSASTERSQEPVSSRYRILIVDDNVDIAQSMAKLLQSSGHDTRSATSGFLALEEAARFLPDAALIDIGMPHVNGYQVAREIREAPWGQSMSLIAVTGWGQDEDKRVAQQAGFDAHVTKPVDPETLFALIEEHVGRNTR